MNYWRLPGCILVIGLLAVGPVLAQKAVSPAGYAPFVRQMRTVDVVPKTICYQTEQNEFVRILPPSGFMAGRRSPNGRPEAPTAQFIVSYSGFTAEAQQAFQYAVDIWSTLLVSSVPIWIQANWVSQQPNILGSASATSYKLGFDGAQKAAGYYPIALAEKIARRQLNNPADADINADFNRNNTWYYGTDGKTPVGQTDLVTVVLHEIAHGLGFIGFFDLAGQNGEYSAGLPAIFDHFIENGQGQRLVAATEAYPNNSVALNRQLTGNNLYLNGQLLKQVTGQRPRLYAPSTFDKGSSIYHLDENTYRSGDINSLMTPQLGRAEAIHTPGPLVLNFLYDMEWKTTSVLHDPIPSSEDVNNLVFSVRVISDTTLATGSVQLLYRKSAPTARDSLFTVVSPTRVGTTNEYRYTLPAAQAQGDIFYFFRAQDVVGRSFTNPGKLPTGAQALLQVTSGPDNVPPTIQYGPDKNILYVSSTVDSLPVFARISDNRPTGIDSAFVEYQINGIAQSRLPLRRVLPGTSDSTYANRILFPANSLKAGDRITYRIVARDASKARNQTINPVTGFYELSVVAIKTPLDQYSNNFNSTATASDFAGYGFSVVTPTGFGDPAIHSDHPYRNGSNIDYQSNYEFVLLSPIRIKANNDSATVRFDEIVLVEPGEDGSQYGDANFYDYVVVEGSSDNGRTWKPLVDGYDARRNDTWLTTYNGNLVTGLPSEKNSAAAGSPALFRPQVISLLSKGSFNAGETILIRFRLFADQLAHGWGWAIDNLRIQLPPPPIVLATEPTFTGTFSVYPNPVVSGSLQIEADLPKPATDVQLSIVGPTGQVMRQRTLKTSGTKLNEQIDLGQLPAGLYFLRLNAGETILTKKVFYRAVGNKATASD